HAQRTVGSGADVHDAVFAGTAYGGRDREFVDTSIKLSEQHRLEAGIGRLALGMAERQVGRPALQAPIAEYRPANDIARQRAESLASRDPVVRPQLFSWNVSAFGQHGVIAGELDAEALSIRGLA